MQVLFVLGRHGSIRVDGDGLNLGDVVPVHVSLEYAES
jgi:hypothetical protein